MQTNLIEITHIGSSTAGVLDIPAKFWPEPGQYLPCQNLKDKTPFDLNLFKVIGSAGVLSLAPLPGDWYPGDDIACLPPHGNGFQLPPSARRVALLAMDVSPIRLLTLVKPALAQGASVTLFYDPGKYGDVLNWLPSAVEVVPLSAIGENLDWPDYLAIDIKRTSLSELNSLLGTSQLTFNGQVLVQTDMPCHGIGECGVCAVQTKHGWRLACKDGPVFPLEDLRNVA